MNTRTKLFSIVGLSLALMGGAAFAQKESHAAAAAKTAKVGEAAPAWKLTDINGKEWKSTDFAGKIVVMEWVNPECPVCKGCHNDGRIPNMIKELKGMDVVFLGINSSANATADKNKEALKAYGVEYPVLLDNSGTVGHAYGAKTTPHVFVIDTKGVLRYAGALDNGGPSGKPKEGALINYPLNAVKQIKANETVSPDSTTSYGCSVKYGQANAEGGSKEKGKDAEKHGSHDGHNH